MREGEPTRERQKVQFTRSELLSAVEQSKRALHPWAVENRVEETEETNDGEMVPTISFLLTRRRVYDNHPEDTIMVIQQRGRVEVRKGGQEPESYDQPIDDVVSLVKKERDDSLKQEGYTHVDE
ncbi:hypothetical protein HQ487_02750 [Candidatus Uhrbacteria bacterium]|nr:hypothetical protein [Candidatus Uhrbacteria bacterium]